MDTEKVIARLKTHRLGPLGPTMRRYFHPLRSSDQIDALQDRVAAHINGGAEREVATLRRAVWLDTRGPAGRGTEIYWAAMTRGWVQFNARGPVELRMYRYPHPDRPGAR